LDVGTEEVLLEKELLDHYLILGQEEGSCGKYLTT
jgi:hypothetical protein